MLNAVAVTTVVVFGMLVGVEFAIAVFVNPIMDRIPDDAGVAARSDGARVLGRVMPFWYIGTLAFAILWTILGWGDTTAWMTLGASVLLLVSVVMSVLLLVPINNRSIRWAEEGAPPDWKEQADTWDRYHYVRVGVIALGFILSAVGLLLI
ncbi:putative membrane protein [Rhodococcus sp. SMB37]|uniref:DUF1772 domain-containing protein n=1 Tax=Rhodococcus sp. SMB37 TaxID=2512213 RepID=UPI0006D0117B|nr:DUF1772 domain-containing protein [Rhodococcus sp. SMB37]TCN46266.1 putative membrane protein [Rhodococcus sp. SMB37]